MDLENEKKTRIGQSFSGASTAWHECEIEEKVERLRLALMNLRYGVNAPRHGDLLA